MRINQFAPAARQLTYHRYGMATLSADSSGSVTLNAAAQFADSDFYPGGTDLRWMSSLRWVYEVAHFGL